MGHYFLSVRKMGTLGYPEMSIAFAVIIQKVMVHHVHWLAELVIAVALSGNFE